MSSWTLSCAVISLLIAMTLAGCLDAGEEEVTRVPQEFDTIQAAIDAAEDDEVIVVSPGVYQERIDFKGKPITVRSEDPGDPDIVASTIIDGNISDTSGSTVTFESGEDRSTLLWGFTITGGSGTGGGVIITGASPTIQENVIVRNEAPNGGGLAIVEEASPLVTGNLITNNNAYLSDGGGGLLVRDSEPVLENNVVSENRIPFSGGGISVFDSVVTMTDNLFEGNEGTTSAMFIVRSEITMKDNVVRDHQGRHMIHVDGASSMTMQDNLVTQNVADNGMIYMRDPHGASATAHFSGNTITENQASSRGGGIVLGGGVVAEIFNNTISDNEVTSWGAANAGGGITIRSPHWVSTVVEVSGNEITGNSAQRCGGGIHASGNVEVVIENNQIAHNIASEDDTSVQNPLYRGKGGGICIRSVAVPALIAGNTIEANTADFRGGGVYVDDDAVIRENVIRANEVLGHHSKGHPGGGGIYNGFFNEVEILDNLVEKNRVEGERRAHGGGIWDDSGGRAPAAGSGETTLITNNTLRENVVVVGDGYGARAHGGGLYVGVMSIAEITFNVFEENRVEGGDLTPDRWERWPEWEGISSGGGLHVVRSDVAVDGNTFTGNSARIGGGMYTGYGVGWLSKTPDGGPEKWPGQDSNVPPPRERFGAGGITHPPVDNTFEDNQAPNGGADFWCQWRPGGRHC